MADRKFPVKFNNPLYVKLDSATTQKLGLPAGLLESIRINGERSNADQVSSAGAATPYQFIPSTRKAILDKYGIDVTLNPENASEGAGLLLKESLDRNGGDVETAVREYHGGTNRENWGKVNDAYAGRVLKGYDSSKIDALSQGFADFLAKNPATAPAPASPNQAAPQPENDALSQGFGTWLDQQKNPVSGVNAIPEAIPGANARLAAQPTQAPQAEPGLVDKIIGTGEAGLALATGATGGALGTLGGALGGLAGSIVNGQLGTQQGVQNIEQAAAQGGQALTYTPRTQSGQEQAAAVGDVINSAIPAFPLTGELGALGQSAGAVARGVQDASAASLARIRQTAPKIAERVQRTLARNPEPSQSSQTAGGSVGAAGQDVATLRQGAAENLPVPIDLTLGERTRNADQLKFEKETAKLPEGAPLRERVVESNQKVLQNFDSWIDQTGKEAPDLRAVGTAVDEALVKKAARDKAEIRTAYKAAEKAGELEQPVELNGLIDHLNDSAPDAVTAPILTVARNRAIQLGIAADDGSGNLVAQPTTLANAERFRQAVGRATDYEATNIRQSAIIKGAVDAATDGLGGNLYKAARRKRELYARQYEDRSIISSLLNNKRGTNDRRIALEDVFDHAISNGSLDDVRQVRRVLLGHDAATPADIVASGHQAWKELQGQTLQWLKDQATKNVQTDASGNSVVSAAGLEKAIRKLDADGKLSFVLGKKGAENVRDINEIVKLIKTAPPESAINYSNTAATILAELSKAGLESGITAVLTGLPIPVLTILRGLAAHAKNVKLKSKINKALERPNRSTAQQIP